MNHYRQSETKYIKAYHFEIPNVCEETQLEEGVSYENYGFRVIHVSELFPFGLDMEKGDLFLGKKKVLGYAKDCDRYPDLKGCVPTMYVMRDRETRRFICGFDLLPDGKCWFGGLNERETKNGEMFRSRDFFTLESAIDQIDRVIAKEWDFFLEEPMFIG
jgi:hypothetical protein